MKVFGLFDRLLGFYRIEVAPADARRVINAVLRRGIAHHRFRRTEEGSLVFAVARKDWRELSEIIDKCGILVYSVYGVGLPFLVRRYRRRVGFAAGALLFAALVWLSTLFVWRIEIEDGAGLPRATVIANLESIGVREGMFIPASDFWELSSRYLSTFDDCAWMSVNLVGTVAKVELRPRLTRPTEPDAPPCNIVAGAGGVIDSFVIHSGKGYIVPGTVVKEGELLVGGIIEDKQGSLRLCAAEAEVYAETERVLCERVELAHTVRVYTGRRLSRSYIGFFALELALPFGDGEPAGDGLWEPDIERAGLLLADGTPLPARKITQSWREYTLCEEYYTAEEARAVADRRMDNAVREQLDGAQILGIVREYTEDADALTLTARVRCICDIAQKKEIKRIAE